MADFEKPRREAEKIWEELCLTEPPLPIVEVAQSYGLKIVEVAFKGNNEISGVLDINNKIIYLNQDDSVQQSALQLLMNWGIGASTMAY